jgi:serine/threonine protein kinase
MNTPDGWRMHPAAGVANERLQVELCALFGRRRRTKVPPTLVPRTVSHYELIRKIGAGARGVVYLARDSRLNRAVAVKVLRTGADQDHESRARFLREAWCVSALSHPNIVTIHDLGHDHGMGFIVMEYVPGKSLDHMIPKDGLPQDVCLAYVLQMARALDAIHSAEMVHRDLKPSNFLITRDRLVKLLDFGLAKVRHSNPADQSRKRGWNLVETHEGTILGTAGYMSPEQVQGEEADRRSDIFSFGATFYEMLTGRRAFKERSAIETMSAILRKAPPSLPARIPTPIAAIIGRCLAKKPNQRYRTGRDLLADLVDLAESRKLGISSRFR